MAAFAEIAGLYSDEEISRMFRVAMELQNDMRYSTSERINLEMALMDMLHIKQSPSLASIIKKLEGGSFSEAADPPPAGQEAVKKKPEGTGPSAPPAAAAETGHRDIKALWQGFIRSISREKKFLYDLLSPVSAELRENTVNLEYPAGDDYLYQARMLDTEKRDFIRDEMSRLLGRKVELQISSRKSGAERAARPAPETVEESRDGGGAAAAEVPDLNPEPRGMDATIEKLKDVFHGEIIEKGE